MTKRITISLVISMLIIFGNIGCFFTTGYQNARMLDQGQVQFIPEISGAADFNEVHEDFYIASGGQLVYGFNDR